MATERAAVLAVPVAAALLLWPALWNGYPIVFADTGTYLSQAIHRYAGWDRPVFYSLFMLALHWTVTLWPVVIAQALLTAWVLWLVWRVLTPCAGPAWFVGLVAALSAGTWLPWIVSELMPDVFTPLLVLVLGVLAWAPGRVSARERWTLVGLAIFFIASQQSSLPLALILGTGCVAWNKPWQRGASAVRSIGLLLLPPVLAMLMLCTVNLAAHGRFAVSPFGNVFLLARVIDDGPGMAALRVDCPAAGWRLCPYIGQFPRSSDDFLWDADSPLYRAGGPKQVSADAGAIIAAAVRLDPWGQARAAVVNAWTQLGQFSSGDGLDPWLHQVSPWVERDFPVSENAAYSAARQQQGQLVVPPELAILHRGLAVAGVVACCLLLVFPLRRGKHLPVHASPNVTGFVLTILLSLPLSAAITGALSAPHDRYQSRIMWLPPFIAAVILPVRLQRAP